MNQAKPLLIFKRIFFLPLLSLVCLNACVSPTDTKLQRAKTHPRPLSSTSTMDMKEYLVALFDSTAIGPLLIAGDTIQHPEILQKAYMMHQFEPFWVNEQGLNTNAENFIHAIKEIRYDGLDPSDYDCSTIEKSALRIKHNQATKANINEFELLMSRSFLHVSNDLLIGSNPSKRNRKDWKIANDSAAEYSDKVCNAMNDEHIGNALELMRPQHRYYNAIREEYKRLYKLKDAGGWNKINMPTDSLSKDTSAQWFCSLRKRLFIETGMPSDTSSGKWTVDLSEAIRHFQYTNHIRPNGKIDSTTITRLNIDIRSKLNTLSSNMERLRWMKHDFPQPYIWVDVAKQALYYIENDSIQFNMKVVVGKPTRPTTMLVARLQNIVFNPPWTVPPTIMKEDVIPGIAKRGPSYLTRKGLKAFDKNGKQVANADINATNINKYKVRQAPGYRSSLGEVKFNLLNPWSIYLHDTPHREDFVKFYRAYSSGCIRVHHPKEFAAFLLRDSAKYSNTKIDSICNTRKTMYVPMHRDVMVHIVYLTNALDSTGHVMYLKDVYKWDAVKK